MKKERFKKVLKAFKKRSFYVFIFCNLFATFLHFACNITLGNLMFYRSTSYIFLLEVKMMINKGYKHWMIVFFDVLFSSKFYRFMYKCHRYVLYTSIKKFTCFKRNVCNACNIIHIDNGFDIIKNVKVNKKI